MIKAAVLTLLLFSLCNQTSVNYPIGKFKPQGNWILCARSQIVHNDTTPWQTFNVNCNSSRDLDSMFNIYIKNTTMLFYTCTASVSCNERWEMLSSETQQNLLLRTSNGFGGYQYRLWFWYYYHDTLTVLHKIVDTLELRYKFIHTEDSVICK